LDIDEDVRRLQVLVNEATPVKSADGAGQTDGDSQEGGQFPGLSDGTYQELPTRITANQSQTVGKMAEFQRFCRPGALKLIPKTIGVLHLRFRRPRCFCACRGKHKNRRAILTTNAPRQDKLAIIPESF
jgi:hypothetical protein